MKKILLVASLVGATLFGANAQESGLEFKGGYSLGITTAKSGDIKVSGSTGGFHVGAVYTLLLSDNAGLELGGLYESFSETENDFKSTLSYLNVPVLGKYYITEGFNVLVGANFGVLLTAKSGPKDDLQDDKEGFNTLNAGLGLGAGYELENGLSFSTRYNIGLSNMIKDAPEDFSSKLSTFQFAIGYKL